MGFFKKDKKVGLFSDVIRCDEQNYLIWKWRPNGKELGESKREYAIRFGSSLRVKDGEVAVFVYKQKNGTYQDYIVGPFDTKIKTANFPVLSSIIGVFVGGDTPFQAEVYFINLAKIIQTKFAVPFFDVSDPRYPDFVVPVAVRGTISFKIEDYKEFIKLHRLDNFDLENFQTQIKDSVSRCVKDAIANAPAMHNIPVVQIESKTAFINDIIEIDLSNILKERFGVVASSIDVGVIEIDKTSDGYQELKKITKDITMATIQGKTAADIEDYAETLRIQREESQYATHKQTQSQNLGAYQIEKQAEVGVASADALGQMGSNNAGNVNIDNGETGFNPASIMASMAMGGVVAQNLSSVMNNAMNVNGSNNNPPPVPKTMYNVAKDGKSTGPFDFSQLSQMAINGDLLPDSLVWKQGMKKWEKAEMLDELKGLFPPPLN